MGTLTIILIVLTSSNCFADENKNENFRFTNIKVMGKNPNGIEARGDDKRTGKGAQF